MDTVFMRLTMKDDYNKRYHGGRWVIMGSPKQAQQEDQSTKWKAEPLVEDRLKFQICSVTF